MSHLKFVPELFLEVAELERFKQFLDKDGFRKNLLENSESFGLIKLSNQLSFMNGRVERDVDNSLGQKTIKINTIQAIDSEGQFIVNESILGIPIPADGAWYWVKINHQYTNQELGFVNIDKVGNLTGINTEFTKILRGGAAYPTRLTFVNSTNNTLEYDVLQVIDDTHAIIGHPAITVGGVAEFVEESNLNYSIVGTFFSNAAIPNANKYPFNYDSCQLTIVPEVNSNIKPTYVIGQEFYLARVRVLNGNLVIQDKRTEYWETKGSKLPILIERLDNPLVGIENVKWQNQFSTNDDNLVAIAWGMRSTNWSIDSSQNIVTLFGSSLGGSFKTVNDFTNGDFNGYRLYTGNGKYSRIISSIKQGSAINLFVDVLDVDNYSNDGGTTFITQELFVSPDCEEVEIKFTASPSDNIENANRIFTFPNNTPLAICLIPVYKDPTCLYNVQYRYKSFKEYTQWQPINSGSYLTEQSFTIEGVLKPLVDRITYDYISDPTAGFIQLEMSPFAYKRFRETVFKGDIIGVNTISNFVAGQVIELRVGVADQYQYITGNIAIGDDIYISLARAGAVEGNEFRLHFDAQMSLGDKRIYIIDNYSSGNLNAIKTITQADIYQMMNIDGGIVYTCIFTDTGVWKVSQNYENGQPFEIKMFDGNLSTYFDLITLEGRAKGYFGWKILSSMTGRVPIGYGNLTVGVDSHTAALGSVGGEIKHKLTTAELPRFSLNVFGDGGNAGDLDSPDNVASDDANLGGNATYRIQKSNQSEPTRGRTSRIGNDQSFNVMQPYRAVAFIQRQY